MKETIKSYFEDEVNSITPPTMPVLRTKQKSIKPWENVVLAVITAAAMFIITLPGAYDSQIRNLTISPEKSTVLMDKFTRVIQASDAYFLKKRGFTDE